LVKVLDGTELRGDLYLVEYLGSSRVRLCYEKGQGFEKVGELAKAGIDLPLRWLGMVERVGLRDEAKVADGELGQLDLFELGVFLLHRLELGAIEVEVGFDLAFEPADGAHANRALQKLLEGSGLQIVVLEIVNGR
jgi:hypothetical protein